MFGKSNLKKHLSKAEHRLSKSIEALAPLHKGGEQEEFEAASLEVLRLERELASSRNEPHAVLCDFPVKWSVGAPMPIMLVNDNKAFLAFFVEDVDPEWDGAFTRVVDASSTLPAKLCLVTFKHSVSTKLGHPSDEVQHGHMLYRKGLEAYTAQIVVNSPWLKEVATMNSVHDLDDPTYWDSLNHYIFWFHDSTFECLATSYEIEQTTESMAELLIRIQSKLF